MIDINTPEESFRLNSKEGAEQFKKIIVICFLGGITSGMLGIGGGVILTPFMLELRIDTIVATSTSNFLLMFTSLAASVLYMLAVMYN